MIQCLKKGSYNKGYTFACSMNDLSELNAYYTSDTSFDNQYYVNNNSKAYIIGTCNYFIYNSSLDEWILVDTVKTMSENDLNDNNEEVSKIEYELTKLEENICDFLTDLANEISITQLTVVELLNNLLSNQESEE